MDLDTALLRAFVTTAEENHFGRAAGRLFISQQALSKRIRRLEELLEARLFERTNRRVELTAAGNRLLPHARHVVDATDAAAEALGRAGGPLRVDVLYEQLTPMRQVRNAIRQAPDLRLEVSSRGDLRPVIPALRRGDFDIAFGRIIADPWPRDIARRLVLLEPVCLLVGAGHPVADRADVSLAELRSLSLWFPMASAPEDWASFVDDLCADHAITVDRSVSTMGFDHFLERAAGEGATFVGMGMRPGVDPGLRVIPIVAPTPVFAWYAMWRRRIPRHVLDRLLASITPITSAVQVHDPAVAWLPPIDRAALQHH